MSALKHEFFAAFLVVAATGAQAQTVTYIGGQNRG